MTKDDWITAGCVAAVLLAVFLGQLTSSSFTGWFLPASPSAAIASGIPAGIVALVVGLAGAGIAFRQWLVARAKLNLDLFEKRLPIFSATKTLLDAAGAWETLPQYATAYVKLFDQAAFLFGPEVEAYMREVYSKCRELGSLSRDSHVHGLSETQTQRYWAATEWIGEATKGGTRKVFEPYLGFGEWR